MKEGMLTQDWKDRPSAGTEAARTRAHRLRYKYLKRGWSAAPGRAACVWGSAPGGGLYPGGAFLLFMPRVFDQFSSSCRCRHLFVLACSFVFLVFYCRHGLGRQDDHDRVAGGNQKWLIQEGYDSEAIFPMRSRMLQRYKDGWSARSLSLKNTKVWMQRRGARTPWRQSSGSYGKVGAGASRASANVNSGQPASHQAFHWWSRARARKLRKGIQVKSRFCAWHVALHAIVAMRSIAMLRPFTWEWVPWRRVLTQKTQ